jgi:WD40 repeat protein
VTRALRGLAAIGIVLLSLGSGSARAQSASIISFERTISIPSYGTGAFVLSPDGRLLATNTDLTTHVYASAGMREVATLTHPKEMYALAFSPNGELLVSSGDGAVAWSTSDWKARWSLPAGTYLGPVAFTPDGRTLYGTGNSQLLAHESATGKAGESTALGNTPVSAVAVSRGGAFVAAGSSGGGLRLIATADRAVTPLADKTHYSEKETAAELTGSLAHPGEITALAFSSDDALLASAGGDGTIKLWKLKPWNPPFEQPVWRIVCGSNVAALVFERGDRTVDAGCGRAIWRIDVRVGSVRARLRSHGDDVTTLAAEPDGIHLWSASLDGTRKRWDLVRGDNVASYGALATAALSADGRTFAFGRGDDAIVLFDPITDRPIATLRGNALPLTLGSYSYSRGTLAVAPNGAYVAAGGYITEGFIDHTGVAGGVTRVWRRSSAQPLQTWNGVAPETLTFAAEGTRLVARSPAMSDTPDTVWTASALSALASVWKPQVKAEGFCRVDGFDEARAAFRPEPALLLAFGECRAGKNAPARLRFWPIGASAPDAPFAGEPLGLAVLGLSPDGRTALSVGTRVTVWDTTARRVLASAPLAPLGKNETVRSVASGGGIAVGLLQTDLWRTDDRYRYALAVWDAATGRQLARTGPRPAGERPQLMLRGDGTRAYVTTPAGIDAWVLKSGAGQPIH